MVMIGSAEQNAVIRIVYDGPPAAGKTASLYALRKLLETPNEIYSPQPNELTTQYFEWLDYHGGVFEGRPIQCQIITAPGAPQLAARRRFLLQTADAVVFVLDSSPLNLAVGLEYLRSLQTILQECEPPVRLLIQAHKQDQAQALPESRLRRLLPPGIYLVESSAITMKGIREAFAVAVSLAAERLRQQKRLETPIKSKSTDGKTFFTEIQKRETSEPDILLADILSAEEMDEIEFNALFQLPIAETAWLWPPLSAQQIFPQLQRLQTASPEPWNESWLSYQDNELSGFSRLAWQYTEIAPARAAWQAQIRAHLNASVLLPSSRYLVLLSPTEGQWRLWQVTSSIPTLAMQLTAVVAAGNIIEIARQLAESIEQFHHAVFTFARYLPLTYLNLKTVAVGADSPLYLGPVEEDFALLTLSPSAADMQAHIHQQAARFLETLFVNRPIERDDLGQHLADCLDIAPNTGEMLLEFCVTEEM